MPTQQPLLTLGSYTVYIVGMERPREKAIIVHLGHGESGDFPSHAVRVECRAVRGQHHDGLANSIGDRAKVRLLLAELLLGALQIIDIGIDPTPADKVGLLIVDRRRGDLEPAILSVEAAKALFRRASFLGLRKSCHQVSIFWISSRWTADFHSDPYN